MRIPCAIRLLKTINKINLANEFGKSLAILINLLAHSQIYLSTNEEISVNESSYFHNMHSKIRAKVTYSYLHNFLPTLHNPFVATRST